MASPSAGKPGVVTAYGGDATAGAEGGGADSFNEDLAWILDKLVDRTGGLWGIISGQWTAHPRPVLLAASAAGTTLDGALVRELINKAGLVARPSALRDHDQPHLLHSLLNHAQADGTIGRYRILQLALAPADGVKVVATVVKDSRLGFKFLEEATAQRLYPVLSRYIRLWWLHRAERRNALILRSVLDMSDLAILLLNRESRLLFANGRGSALLQAQDGLCYSNERVRSVIATDQEQLQKALANAAQGNQNPGSGAAVDPVILQVGRQSEKRDLILAISPLRAPALDSEDAAISIHALDPDQDAEDLLVPVCAIYRLTAAEARLVGQLVSGCSIAEAAERSHIQPQTARAYLKSIFSKTRTHRQAELVRVMLSSALRTAPGRIST